MIITQKKPIEELMAMVADAKTVAIVAASVIDMRPSKHDRIV